MSYTCSDVAAGDLGRLFQVVLDGLNFGVDKLRATQAQQRFARFFLVAARQQKRRRLWQHQQARLRKRGRSVYERVGGGWTVAFFVRKKQKQKVKN
jgi:hypothetical protein